MSPESPMPSASEFDLAILAGRMWRNAVRLLAICAAAGALAIAVTYLLPKWYQATAVILPPDESDLFSNLSMTQKALSKFPSIGSLGDYFTPADIYKATLRSRMVREHVADRFDLQRVYRLKSREQTLKALGQHTSVTMSPDGTISISVEDRDPKRATGMAATYLEALDHYNIEKRNIKARRTREFLEHRVVETDSLLRVSETRLRAYQKQHHVVAPAQTGGGDVAPVADVIARKMMLEVRLGVLRSYLREDNDQIIQSRTELEQLKRRIAGLPEVREDLARLQRDNLVQEQIYLMLIAELEQARIQELRDTPTVQVLDPPVVPERHSRPRRLIIAIAASVLAGIGCVTMLVFREDLPSLMRR